MQEAKGPLYLIVRDKIRELVESGVFKPGHKLPRETDLADMLNVSRNTLREALRLASTEGWVIQKHGIGTFISPRSVVEQGLEVLESLDSLLARHGLSCGTEELVIGIQAASQQVAFALDLPVGAEVVKVSRVKTSREERIAFIEDYFPTPLVDLEEFRAAFTGSTLDYFIKRGDPALDYAWTELRALHAGKLLAEKLHVAENAIVRLAEETLVSKEGLPFEYSLNYMVMDFFRFHIIRTIPQ